MRTHASITPLPLMTLAAYVVPGAGPMLRTAGSASSPGLIACRVPGNGAGSPPGEGAWNYGRGLAQFLVTQGETVYEVNPRWTAERRRRARKTGKRDQLDAHAVAKFVRDEATTVPCVLAEDTTAVLDLLVTERDAALAEATRLRNQLHQLLLQVDPDYKAHLPSLTSKAGMRAVESYALAAGGSLHQHRVAAIHRLAQRLRLALEQAAVLAQEICALAEAHDQPLTLLKGVGLFTAGALAGILGPGQRFRSEVQLAAYAGVAPLEASSAGYVRQRLNRGGNRRLNAILYRIAVSQAHSWPPAQAYLARRKVEGKTWREAIRAGTLRVKRYLVRAIWRLWQQCFTAQMVTHGAEGKECIN